MKNIYIFSWNHQFNAVHAPAELIAEGLRQIGNRVTIVNTSTEHGKSIIIRMLSEKVDLIIGMNPHSFLYTINGQLIHKVIKSRFAIMFLDNPIYTRTTWSLLFNNGFPVDSLLLCIDAKQAEQFKEICRDLYNNNFITVFFPWGGHHFLGRQLTPSEKNYDLCLFSTLDQQISENFKLHDDYQCHLSKDICASAAIPYDEFFETVSSLIHNNYSQDIIELISKKLNIRYSEFTKEAFDLAAEVDSFLKRYRRLAVAKEMLNVSLNNNYEVAIFGTGWENLGKLPSNIKIFGPTYYEKQFEIFNSSKSVLNTDPNWICGVHDRVFNAFGSGCAVVTNQNKYTDFHFQDSENCSIYETTNQIADKITFAVENHISIAHNAHRILIVNHTWKDRCRLITNILDY